MRQMTGAVRTFVLAAALSFTACWAGAGQRVNVAVHGKRTYVGAGAARTAVLYLRGTPFEMGFAHGALCKTEVAHLVRTVMPAMLLGMGVTPARVDQVWKGYAKHLRPEYLEEVRGLAAGSGLPLAEVQRFHAIPDISEWHCTFFAAAKGPAARELVQIRALDYETRAGIQMYPALIVCKPVRGVPFVNVGWLGHCGLVTGMNASGIAMSEIGDDWDMAADNFDGRPLNYVMRDVVQFSRNLSEALSLVKDKPRTTSLLYCISSARENQVRALQTSRTQCRIYTPANLPFRTKPGLVYLSMGMDSNWNPRVGAWLLGRYGKLDALTAMRMMKELKTGSLHAVVLMPASGDVWVANATDTAKGYDQPYARFSLTAALKDPFFRK